MKKTVIILSVSSDIGLHLARKYLNQGFRVIGTYRSKSKLKIFEDEQDCSLIKCDVFQKADLDRLAAKIKGLKVRWDVFISCVGHPLPVRPFFECDFDEWAASVHVNSIAQLRALHVLYPLRNTKKADAVFFAGGGANGAVLNFSAYTIAKIMLTKMCEFLDAENKNLNIFIVGPGWTKTKIHHTILSDRKTAKDKVSETRRFLKGKQGTSLDDIYACIDWLCREGKTIASGRNFSIAHDPWRKPLQQKLIKALSGDKDMYKLRRQGNSFLQHR